MRLGTVPRGMVSTNPSIRMVYSTVSINSRAALSSACTKDGASGRTTTPLAKTKHVDMGHRAPMRTAVQHSELVSRHIERVRAAVVCDKFQRHGRRLYV